MIYEEMINKLYSQWAYHEAKISQKSFEAIASEISIEDLIIPANPSVDVSIDDSEERLFDYIEETIPWHSVTSVYKNGKMLGCVIWLELEIDTIFEKGSFVGILRKIELDDTITSDTKFLNVVDIFNDKDVQYLFAVKHNRIVGLIRRRSLERTPIFKIITLSLIFQLEDLALQVCKTDPSRFWNLLSEDRQEMAEKIVKHDLKDDAAEIREIQRRVLKESGNVTSVDFGSKSFDLFLSCTTFVDKKTMITKSKILDKNSTKEFDGLCRKIEKIRNSLVHPGRERTSEQFLTTGLVADLQKGIRLLGKYVTDSQPPSTDENGF